MHVHVQASTILYQLNGMGKESGNAVNVLLDAQALRICEGHRSRAVIFISELLYFDSKKN